MDLSKQPFTRKLATAVLVLCLGLVTVPLQAQEGTVRFRNRQASVGEALKQIEAQTDFNFALSHKNFDVSKNVTLRDGAVPVKSALETILAGSGQTWLVSGKHIIIVPERDKGLDPAKIPADRLIMLSEVLAQSPVQTTATTTNQRVEMRTVKKVEKVQRERTEVSFNGTHRQSQFETRNWTGTERTGDRPPRFGIKLNLLYGLGTLTPNLGVEFGLGQRTSLDIYAAYNPWKLDNDSEKNKKMVHTIVQPEFRYWFCERFNGHFIGLHATYTNFNISGHKYLSYFDKDSRYEGHSWGGGISYGYHLMLARKWGLEFNVGFGIARMKYERSACTLCSDPIETRHKTYYGPTKAGITLVFNIK